METKKRQKSAGLGKGKYNQKQSGDAKKHWSLTKLS